METSKLSINRMRKSLQKLKVVLVLASLLANGQALADQDGDGVSDKHDLCPQSNQQQRVDPRGCEFDSDGDGVVDAVDQCPASAAGIPVSIRGCGHDSDKDQVSDYRDRCPNSARDSRVDAVGCPLSDSIALPGLVFAKGSSTLNRRAKSVLDRAANTLFKYPNLKVEVAGYTDSKGNDQRNRELSQSRASAVRKYLVSLGLPSGRISARGYGEADPIGDNNTAAGRAQNRRVVLKLRS